VTTATKAPAKDSGKKTAAPALRPFFAGTLDLETHTYVQTGTLSTAQQELATYYPKTNGFLADLWIHVYTNATPNTDNDVAFNEDMPWSAIASVTFSDTGGQPILGPMSGWELKTFVKWGGFSFSDDPQNSLTYTATTGTSTAGGHFKFLLHLPIQFVAREPLGPLPNTNNNNAYALDITINTLANIYSTAPDAAPTFTVKVYQDSYRQSSGKDAQGNATVTTPPGLGAVLYLRRATQDMSSGSIDAEIDSVPEGSHRCIHFVLRDDDGTRATGDTDWPDPLAIFFNNDVPWDRAKQLWIRKQERTYGYINAVNTAGGRDYGTFTLPFITDGELKGGAEDRYRYLSISAADTFGIRGTIGGSGTKKMTMMYDFVRPPGGNIRGMTAR
jgi:hypothetical protein